MRRGRIAAVSIAFILTLWVATAVWLVPWVIAKAYAGEAGALLNARITGQAHAPVEAYLDVWRGIALRLTIALVAGIAAVLLFIRYREQLAPAARRTLPALPARESAGVLILAAWAGGASGIAEAFVSGVRTLALDLPVGGVPWPRPLWMALLAAGCGVAFARAAARWPHWARRVVRWSLPAFVLVVATAAAALPVRDLLDRRALAELSPADPAMPSVLIIVWDAVRASNLSLYGADRETTPELEALAAQGVVFDRAISTAPWSLPSHAGLFTGRYPFELSAGWTDPLDDTHPTLAVVLSDAGYATAGFVGNLYYGRRGFGLERGFAHYDDLSPRSAAVIARSWWLSWKIASLGVARGRGRHEFAFVERSALHPGWEGSRVPVRHLA